MTRLIKLSLLLATAIIAVQNSPAEGQIFRRRWERRKAQIKAEVGGQLSKKLEQDVAREMDSTNKSLTESNQQQFNELRAVTLAESETLKAEILDNFAKMRKEAEILVASEAEKLDKLTQTRIKELQAAANKKIDVATKQLNKQFETKVAELKRNADDRVAKALELIAKQGDAQNKAITDQIAKLPTMVDSRLNDMMPEISAAIKKQIDATPSQPAEEQDPGQEQEQAINEPAPNAQEEREEDEADDDSTDADAGNDNNEN